MTYEEILQRQTLTRQLYREMPGAERVEADAQGVELWEEVEQTQHYRFCAEIVDVIYEAKEG